MSLPDALPILGETDAKGRFSRDIGQQPPDQRTAARTQLVEMRHEVEALFLTEAEADLDPMRMPGQGQHAIDEPEGIARQHDAPARSDEHTSELQSLMRSSYAVFCLKKK